jgi:hypothetical protein
VAGTGEFTDVDNRLLFLFDEDALNRVPKSRLFLAGTGGTTTWAWTGTGTGVAATGPLSVAGLGAGSKDKEAAPPAGIEGLPCFAVAFGTSCKAGGTPGADDVGNDFPEVLL